MAAHRYWRLNVSAVGSGGYVALEELAFYSSTGQVLSVGGTPAASSSYPGDFAAANAFDNTFSKIWHSGDGALPDWLSYDFGSAVDVAGITIRPREGFASQAPRDFKLQYSDDNSSWSDQASYTGVTWVSNVPQSFPKVDRMAWRINATASGASAVALAEVEFRSTVGGASFATRKSLGLASSSFGGDAGGFGPPSAFDGDAATLWSSSGSAPQHIGYQNGADLAVAQVSLRARNDSSYAQAPTAFDVQYMDAAGVWQTLWSESGVTWTQGQVQTFDDPGASSPDVRATQAAVLTLGKEVAGGRVSQLAVLTLAKEGVDARATQLAVLALSKELVDARATQLAALALVHETPCLQKLAQCWSIARTDGVTLRYTTHDEPVTLQGEVYAPCDSLRVSAQSGGMLSGGTVGDAGVRGLIVDGAITQRDILGGLYDGAVVEVWEQQWDSANEAGFIPRRLARGIFGKITHGDVAYDAELVSPGARLMQRPLLRPHTPACRYDLGDGRCPVALGPLTVSGSATATPARSALHRSEFRMFADSTRAEADGYFADGRVTWTSGLNTGFSAEIRTNAAGVFTLWAPMPYKIAAGDAYTMTPGCNKTRDDHTVKFGLDMVDFGGFPDLPGNDAILQTPNAKS